MTDSVRIKQKKRQTDPYGRKTEAEADKTKIECDSVRIRNYNAGG